VLYAAFSLHLIHVAWIQVVSICIPRRHLHVSCIGDKNVVTATSIHLYPQVEHCLELLSVYMYPSTCRWIQVARTDTCIGYMYLLILYDTVYIRQSVNKVSDDIMQSQSQT